MSEPSLILFDDTTARAWEPFALTRPAGELLFGALTLRERAERALGVRCTMHLGGEHLQGFTEEGSPPVFSFEDAPTEGDRIFLLSRALPDLNAGPAVHEWTGPPGAIRIGGRTVGWHASAGKPPPSSEFFEDPESSPRARARELPGRVLENVWELVSANPDQITRDIEALFPSPSPAALPDGVYHRGEYPLVFGENVDVEPGVVLDTRKGPIWLGDGVRVHAFTRLAGPAYIGPGCTLLGGSIEAVSAGPVCKLRGELAESICLGYVNKAHDGHMGHAYLGRWVNLGAETTNSDLKNNYGTIRIWTPEGTADTGEVKLGCLLGDHVKTGIGLLLNTGTVVGAGSNLYGASMPPKYVPPFSWGTGEELVEYRLDKFLEVAERAMARREVELSPDHRRQLERSWERGRANATT